MEEAEALLQIPTTKVALNGVDIMEFFSSVPLVDGKNCPDNEDHNRLANQVNKRLTRSGPDCVWRIFYYADSIFTGMRNTATPSQPLGVNPAEDEWWKVYMAIEYPVSSTGVGNWPLALAGTPQGANVMNPLNAFIFGRKTAENKLLEKMGPWAEGNMFDGLVSSSKAVLTNKQFWEDAFLQRGVISRNENFTSKNNLWEGYKLSWLGRRIDSKYLPDPEDPVFFSKSLTTAGMSADKHFQEYASNHIYMRYAPAVQGGNFIKYGQAKSAPHGVLKRKNAAKDLLQWALWCYVYYFRGSEAQRSLFCSAKPWSTKMIDYKTTEEVKKSLNIEKTETKGPLNICKVGFDFYKYFTRQNVFAPALGIPHKLKGDYEELSDTGDVKLKPYRVSFSTSISHIAQDDEDDSDREMKKDPARMFCRGKVINYDTINAGFSEPSRGEIYGKTIKFPEDKTHIKMKCDYDSHKPEPEPVGRKNKTFLNFDSTSGKGTKNRIKSCLAGYYLETEAIENPSMSFKFQICVKGTEKLIHETIINSTYSYKVSRNRPGKKAYVFNKMFYFKEGVKVDNKNIEFRIIPIQEDDFGNKVLSVGNPWSTSVDTDNSINLILDGETAVNDIKTMFVPSGKTANIKSETNTSIEANYPSHILVKKGSFDKSSTFSNLKNGDLVRVKSFRKKDDEEIQSNLDLNDTLFVRRETDKDEDGTENQRIFFTRRQDDRLKYKNEKNEDGSVDFGVEEGMANPYANLAEDTDEKFEDNYLRLVIEKLIPPQKIFKVKVDLAILQKRKPNFRDAYALFRVTTAKQNRAAGNSSPLIFGDAPGVGVAGYEFEDSNRVFNNYFKYGSAMNMYGSSVVPALRQYISANPIYESMRRFISSYMRFADRQQLVNYTVEGGAGVLYFKRFAYGLGKSNRATIFRNMEPSIEPAGWFTQGGRKEQDPDSSKFVPIKKGEDYKVACGEGRYVYYEGKKLEHGATFEGGDKDHLDSVSLGGDERSQGAFELNGINSYNGNAVSNEWVMFMTSSHYHPANSNIYKPSIYNDIMGFLNNRCHHRSKEYEDSTDDKYDMIRSELLRIPTSPSNTPGRLQVFLSKSSPNFNYVFNTNDPDQGNLDLYSETGDGRADYLKSCPAVTPKPYRVKKTEVVNSRGNLVGFNPSSKLIGDRGLPPFEIVKVTLDRPLRGTGRLSVGSKGWAGVTRSQLKKEPYRSDENAIIEYLHHSMSGNMCKRTMIGDYGASSDVVEGDGYRPFGACYPRFYFLKLIPKVPNGALLDSEPYAQMDFYFRAMSNAFVNPFPVSSLYAQTSALNWKYSEIASRSSEEDPTKFDYVDPMEITS